MDERCAWHQAMHQLCYLRGLHSAPQYALHPSAQHCALHPSFRLPLSALCMPARACVSTMRAGHEIGGAPCCCRTCRPQINEVPDIIHTAGSPGGSISMRSTSQRTTPSQSRSQYAPDHDSHELTPLVASSAWHRMPSSCLPALQCMLQAMHASAVEDQTATPSSWQLRTFRIQLIHSESRLQVSKDEEELMRQRLKVGLCLQWHLAS